MSTNQTLTLAATPVSRPNPNLLSTRNPYPVDYSGALTVSTAWGDQGIKALFPGHPVCATQDIFLDVVPTVDGTETRLVLWYWNRKALAWVRSNNNPVETFIGAGKTYIEQPGDDPIYLEVLLGSCHIYFDPGPDGLWRAL